MASEHIARLRHKVITGPIEKCRTCGKCCKEVACTYAPLDFFDENDRLDLLRIEGKILANLACLELMNNIYSGPIVRVSAPPIIYDKFDVNTINSKCGDYSHCSLLGDEGCKITTNDERPFGGLVFAASENGYGFCGIPAFIYEIFDENAIYWTRNQFAMQSMRTKLKQMRPDGYLITKHGVDIYEKS